MKVIHSIFFFFKGILAKYLKYSKYERQILEIKKICEELGIEMDEEQRRLKKSAERIAGEKGISISNAIEDIKYHLLKEGRVL